jgi:methylphosphotriester-DNA--protein-cysteine methyltransferase
VGVTAPSSAQRPQSRGHRHTRRCRPDRGLEEADETKILTNLSDALRTHRDRLQLAIRQSVVLGLTGLGSAALGYVLDKMFFGN